MLPISVVKSVSLETWRMRWFLLLILLSSSFTSLVLPHPFGPCSTDALPRLRHFRSSHAFSEQPPNPASFEKGWFFFTTCNRFASSSREELCLKNSSMSRILWYSNTSSLQSSKRPSTTCSSFDRILSSSFTCMEYFMFFSSSLPMYTSRKRLRRAGENASSPFSEVVATTRKSARIS